MTNRLELNWKLDGFADEQRYYCSETPIDVNNLPNPKAILAGDVRTYIDTEITTGKTYYLCVSSVKNGVEKLSNEILITPSQFDVILDLFINNEDGYCFDFNDLSTMFQDVIGTIPVTAEGQYLGLILDKSKNLNIGTPVSFLNFSESAWMKTPAVTEFNTNSFTTSGVGGVFMNTTSFYKKAVRINIVGSSSVPWTLRKPADLGGAIVVPAGAFNITSVNPVFTITDGVYVSLSNAGSISFDKFEIAEQSGNHAFQTNSTKRPLVNKNTTTGAHYVKFNGTSAFLKTNPLDFATHNTITLFSGVRKLDDSAARSVYELENNSSGALYGMFCSNNGSSYNAFNSSGLTWRYGYVTGYSAPISSVITSTHVSNATSDSERVKIQINNDNTVINYSGSAGYENTNTFKVNVPLYIGGRNGAEYFFNGDIYTLVGVCRATTELEKSNIKTVIASNLGITL